jgi:hypothetical protein
MVDYGMALIMCMLDMFVSVKDRSCGGSVKQI